jgi:hypothetical protein
MKVEELTQEQLAALSPRQRQWYALWNHGSVQAGELLQASLPEQENEHA